MAWIYQDESSPLADSIMQRLRDDTAVVPGLWRLEVANGLVSGARRRRLTDRQIDGVLRDLGLLNITVDPTTADRALGAVLDLALGEQLTAYDAAYLELALRMSVPLASLDKELCAAAVRRGVRLLAA